MSDNRPTGWWCGKSRRLEVPRGLSDKADYGFAGICHLFWEDGEGSDEHPIADGFGCGEMELVPVGWRERIEGLKDNSEYAFGRNSQRNEALDEVLAILEERDE